MLTQSQTIRALADALAWFEKELGWGVSPASISHLTGRMGELYVTVMTRGQMATSAMQKGYDVVSAEGERISVKTITSSSHVAFNRDTLGEVDRVMILRVIVDETDPSIEEILDCHVSELAPLCREYAGKLVFSISAAGAAAKPLGDLKIVSAAFDDNVEVRQLENGTIVVLEGGVPVPVAKPVLRRIAHDVGVDILNSNGNRKNTRSLGADVITALQDRAADEPPPAPSVPDQGLTRLIEACLVGGAVGDALGAEIEFWSLDQIRQRFPDGIRDLPPHDGMVGAVTDDTQMTLFTAEGLIRAMVRFAAKGICHVPSVVHHALLRWLRTQGETAPALEAAGSAGPLVGLVHDPRLQHRRAPGLTCLGALGSATEFGQPAINDSKGCGTIMRVAPIAFLDRGRVRAIAEECSALTHGHPTGQEAAATWALILNGVIHGESIEEAARQQLGQFNQDVEGALRAALSAPRDGTPETVETLGAGWIAEEALAIALYACLAAEDFETGLRIGVTHGGDSDSTGAIAGNALGLIYPEQALTHRWSQQVECRDLIAQVGRDFARATLGHTEELWDTYPGW